MIPTNLQLTRALLDCLGASWEVIRHVADRKGHDRRYALDDALLRGMGYAPRIAFPDGLAPTVRWRRDNVRGGNR